MRMWKELCLKKIMCRLCVGLLNKYDEEKLNLVRLTVRLGLTVLYFPIFRQARPLQPFKQPRQKPIVL